MSRVVKVEKKNLESGEVTVKTIKLFEGYRVYCDGEVEDFIEKSWDDVMDYINMHKDKQLRDDLFREIFCFHKLDLSRWYGNHTLIITLIPYKGED